MPIAHYIKEIGRGKDGARALTQAQAHDLMTQLLRGQLSDLEVGAFVLAMRIKGETVDELAGFVSAAQDHCIAIPSARPMIVLPSYNGARKLPNLTPLLALLLAQEGVPVLVHGPMHAPQRISTAEIFRDLGLPFATDANEVENAWSRYEPVFMRTEDLCPPLARLLGVRDVVGVRNSGHAVAKVLAAGDPRSTLRVVNHTHPEYAHLQSSYLTHSRAHAMLLRGTEGEPVADPRRVPRMDVFIDGVARPDLSRAAHEGVLTELPVLPRGLDASTTARYIQSVVSGEKPAPSPLTQQVECLMRALREIGNKTPQERIA